MAKKVIKAKNVVSFSDAENRAQETAPVKEDASVLREADEAIEKIEQAAKQLEESAADVAETAEADVFEGTAPEETVETRPLNLRTSRYLDDTPQDGDWTDEDFDDYDDYEEPAGDISTFAEVFIPLHHDSTAAVVRKGMAIVCVIVIICCLVALALKGGQVSAIAHDITAQAEQAVMAAAVLLHL
ncbi:MAG: hypothetical protein ILO43_06435 [Clostridia bacterium]|nr:hypothetical protein [Clostridia bacterium]